MNKTTRDVADFTWQDYVWAVKDWWYNHVRWYRRRVIVRRLRRDA